MKIGIVGCGMVGSAAAFAIALQGAAGELQALSYFMAPEDGDCWARCYAPQVWECLPGL